MTTLDVFIALFVVLTVLRGARTGFLAGVFSLVGVILGASLGSRVAPYLLPEGESPAFVAGITLISILAFAAFGEVVARTAGGARTRALPRAGVGGRRLRPPDPAAHRAAPGREGVPHPASAEGADALRAPDEGRRRAGPATRDPGSRSRRVRPQRTDSGRPGRARGGLADGAREEHSLRLQHRGLGLGRRPGSHRHQRPRGRRCDHDQSPTRGHGTAP